MSGAGRSPRSIGAVAAVIALSVSLAASLAGCCNLLPDPGGETQETAPEPPEPTPEPPEPTTPTGPDTPITVSKTLVNLGVVAYPAGTPPSGAAMHGWTAPKLKPPAHKLGYALSAAEKKAVEDDLLAYAKQLRYKDGDKGRFFWVPPKGCSGDMHCVLERLASRSRADIAPLTDRFAKRMRDAKLNALDTATMVLSFVQAIPYEVPKSEPFGLLPPARVVFERRGDCDSKALLGHMILTALGVQTVVISSEAHKHAMLGVALPAGGKGFNHQGTRYAFAETTAKGSPVGHINPELLKPNDWRVVPIKLAGAK